MDIERVMASSQSSAQAGSIVMPGTCHASQSWSQQKLPFILTQTVLMSSVTAAVKITNIVIAGLYCTMYNEEINAHVTHAVLSRLSC